MTFGSNLVKRSNEHRVNEATSSTVAQSWPLGSQIAGKKVKCKASALQTSTLILRKLYVWEKSGSSVKALMILTNHIGVLFDH